MEKKTGTAATKAKNKYNAANYERLYPFVKKGKKERYQKAAEAAGFSLNEFMGKGYGQPGGGDPGRIKSISPRRTQRRGRFGVCPPECSIFFGADY